MAQLQQANRALGFRDEWLRIPDRLPDAPTVAREPSLEDLQRIAWLLDLTSLGSDDTEGRVRALAQRAVRPLGDAGPRSVAAVCVYPAFLPTLGTWLAAEGVRVATVAGGFPHALSTLETRLEETRRAARAADEVDVPIPRYLAREGRWRELYEELALVRQAAQHATLKVILSCGELRDPRTVYQAAMVAMMAGADFVKTSTGKDGDVAQLELGPALCQAILDFRERTGAAAGLKAAGGIRTADEAFRWLELVRTLLGEAWLTPERLRIGASALLDDLARLTAE